MDIDFSESQRQAIDCNDSNLRIIACAGSGKTSTIAGKIIHLLDPENGLNVSPSSIIAFTYTEKAAAELKSKVLKFIDSSPSLLGLRGVADMYIGTIHGWCLKALQDNEFGFQKCSVLDEIKLRLFVDKHYYKIGMKDISRWDKPNKYLQRFVDTERYVQIMNVIRESEIEGTLPDSIQIALEKYEETLLEKNYLDFTMIMTKTMERLVKESNLTAKIRSELKYLIVDEYQDVNSIQEKLIRRLWEISRAYVTVVGDDDQNIYQWRGSNNQFIQNFHESYAPVKQITLNLNYRSSNGITRIAEALIKNNDGSRIPKQMISAEEQEFVKGEDALYHEYSNVHEENVAIARTIKNLIGVAFEEKGDTRGLAYSDCCILLRKWNKAEAIAQVLDEFDIPYITAGVNQLLETTEVKAAIGIFKYLQGQISDKDDLYHLWALLPIKNYDYSKLKKALDQLDDRKPIPYEKNKVLTPEEIEANKKESWAFGLQDIFWEFIEVGELFEEVFIDYTNEETIKRTTERAEIIFYNLGKFSQVIQDYEEINFNSSKPSLHLFGFLSFIQYAAQDYYPEGWLNNTYKTPNAVQIMTVHQSKGLEFPAVFIPGLNKNYLPAKKKGGLNEWHFLEKKFIKNQARYEGSDEDERRLLYVAITRAQKFLFISRAPDLSNRLYQVPSIFEQELLKSKLLFESKDLDFSDREKVESTPKENVRTILLNFTILKDFFECSYRFKLISMYGFSYPLNQRMGLGRSFHNSLMEMHKRGKEGEDLDEEEVLEIVERQKAFPYIGTAEKLVGPLNKIVRERVVEYHQENKDSYKDIVFVEQDIQLRLDDEILVTGRVDLIKKEKEDGKYETTIIEFKSKEEQASETTKDQLLLYALGHKELTGEVADYLMVYIIGENREKARVVLMDRHLEETEGKINSAAVNIRNQKFARIKKEEVCAKCYQNSLCSARVDLGVKSKRK